MGLTAAQKQLRADIKRANSRLTALKKAGITSPAAERALTALGNAQNFNLGAKPSKMRELIVAQAVKKFLKAETSTIKGFKAVQARREKGLMQSFRDLGVKASPEMIKRALSGAASFRLYAELTNVSTDEVQTYFAQAAEMGDDVTAVEERLQQRIDNTNPDIDVDELDDDETADWWDL